MSGPGSRVPPARGAPLLSWPPWEEAATCSPARIRPSEGMRRTGSIPQVPL